MINVKLVKLGTPIREYPLNDGSTLGDLLNVAGENFTENAITINNSAVSRTTRLYNGDRVFIGNAVKGNVPFEVSFVQLGGDANISLPAEDGWTINRVLEQLPEDKKPRFFDAAGKHIFEYRIGGGQPLGGEHVLTRPVGGTVRILMATRTKGN